MLVEGDFLAPDELGTMHALDKAEYEEESKREKKVSLSQLYFCVKNKRPDFYQPVVVSQILSSFISLRFHKNCRLRVAAKMLARREADLGSFTGARLRKELEAVLFCRKEWHVDHR